MTTGTIRYTLKNDQPIFWVKNGIYKWDKNRQAWVFMADETERHPGIAFGLTKLFTAENTTSRPSQEY